ncbi:MAG: YqgE/AlgH family protein [Desulfosarcinaceae bacterium]|nr:YqgE/AlgH family protein [Desulfosarcinaceae bacterium]
MQTSSSGSLKGQLLVAMPGLSDPNFHRSVTCISEHTAQGAVGVVVNQVHAALTAGLIFEELKLESTVAADNLPVHIGGPVHVNELFVLHGPPFDWEGTLAIQPQLALSNSKDILAAIARSEGPDAFIISLGCAGWGPGQLEYEIKENVWLNCPYAAEIAFQLPVEQRWDAAMERMGIDPTLLSGSAGHA